MDCIITFNDISFSVFNDDFCRRLIESKPENVKQSEISVKENLTEALKKDLKPFFDEVVEKRRSQLCQERKRFRERFESEGSADWVKGIDRLDLASIDMLTITIYYPLPGGG